MQMVLPSPAAGLRGVACAAAEACRQVRAGRRESWPPPWAPPVDAVTAQSLHVDVTEITKALLMGHCLLSAQCRGARRVGVGCSSLCMGMGTFVTFRSASSSTERGKVSAVSARQASEGTWCSPGGEDLVTPAAARRRCELSFER